MSDTTPLLLIRGSATDEEVAAVVAVLQGMAGAGEVTAGSAERPVVSEWGAPHRKVRGSYPHAAGGWRASALPR